MNLFLVFSLSTLVGLLFLYLPKCVKYLRLSWKIRDSSGLIPLIGIIPEFIGIDLHEFFKVITKYNNKIKDDVEKVWFGPQVVIVINSPEAMQKVLNAKECLDKPWMLKFFGIERASLFGSLDAWRVHRKIMNGGFNPQNLKSFVTVFNKKSRVLIDSFKSNCDDGKEFDVFPLMSAFFLDTILSAALDLDVDIMNDEKKLSYVQYFDE